MKKHDLFLFAGLLTLTLSFQSHAWTPDQELMEGKIAAAEENMKSASMHPKMMIANNLYKQILNIDEEIATRADMRFSEDLEKGEASSRMQASGQLTFVAGEIVRDLRAKESVSTQEYEIAIRQLREIKTELKKMN